jgi:pilus assembly protein Flp/PilA
VQRFFRRVQRFLRAEDGPTAVEYAVMVALIALTVVSGVRTLGCQANEAFDNAAEGLPQ